MKHIKDFSEYVLNSKIVIMVYDHYKEVYIILYNKFVTNLQNISILLFVISDEGFCSLLSVITNFHEFEKHIRQMEKK